MIVDHLDSAEVSPFVAKYREALEAYFKRLSDAESNTPKKPR